jgi:hypothetical protein
MSDIPYNPLDRKNLGASVAEALLARPVQPLADVVATRFEGSGIYVLYYVGDFQPYAPLANLNRNGEFRLPIYIGKAVPEGARKGGGQGKKKKGDRALHKRLKEHAKSIAAATTTLRLADFQCRYLRVEDIWIPLGESLLIAKFLPVWNKVVEGFGNHAPGGGRYSGKIPLWDVFHPGRDWGAKCQPRPETVADIETMINNHFRDSLDAASAEVRGAATFAELAEDAPIWLGPTNSGETDEEDGSE